MTGRVGPVAALIGSIMSGGVLAGCSLKVLTPSPEDRLREENAQLETDIAALRLELEEVRKKLADLAEPGDDGATPDPEALAARPRLVGIEIAGSSVIEADREGRGVLALRLVTRDGRGRFVQVAGRVSIRASVLGRQDVPRLVGEREFDPLEVRDAWRSGFFGTLYLFEVPIEIPPGLRSAEEATVLATLHDAIGGGEYSSHELVPIVLDDPSPRETSPRKTSP